jgi:hypothetical protein
MCDHDICQSIDLGHCTLGVPTCDLCKSAPAVGSAVLDCGSFGLVRWACDGCKGRGIERLFVPIADTNLGRMRREAGL